MKINLSYDAFDAIMKVTKPFVSKDAAMRPVFTQILLESDNGKVTATALDGVKAVKLTVAAETETETGSMLIPWVKPIGKRGVYALITDDEKSITIETVTEQRTFRKVQGSYANTDRFFENKEFPETTMYFDPKQLADALTAFDDKVKIEYFGAYKGVIITDLACEQKAFVLPTSPPKKR